MRGLASALATATILCVMLASSVHIDHALRASEDRNALIGEALAVPFDCSSGRHLAVLRPDCASAKR